MSFSALGVDERVVAVLTEMGITEPTPVQRLAIPALLGGSSATVVARTGSGKTLAYAVPVAGRAASLEVEQGPVTERGRPRAVVLTSTRELVTQTTKVFKGVCHQPKLRVRGLSGGMTGSEMARAVAEPFDVAIGNPSRILAMCAPPPAPKPGARSNRSPQALLSLADVGVLVVDEADTLLAPGTRPEIVALLDLLPAGAQVVFISATLPEPIRHFVSRRDPNALVLMSKDAHASPERVTVRNLSVPRRGRPETLEPERLDTLDDVLGQLEGRGMIFVNRRESAEAVGTALRERGHAVAVMEGAMSPQERRKVFRAFCAGEPRLLVATELGGRGIDVADLKFVVNFELPPRLSEYLHRVGRVGRQGRPGQVVNLVAQEDADMVREIKRLASGGRLDTGEALRVARTRKVPVKTDAPRSGDAKTGERKPLKPGSRSSDRKKAPVHRKPRAELEERPQDPHKAPRKPMSNKAERSRKREDTRPAAEAGGRRGRRKPGR